MSSSNTYTSSSDEDYPEKQDRIRENQENVWEEMPQPRKKKYSNRPSTKLPGTLTPEEEAMERCGYICKIVVFVLFVGVVITLTVLATGDRPLAVAIRNSMNFDLISSWVEKPSNDTDGMGDHIEDHTHTVDFYPTEPSWETSSTTPSTKKPSQDEVTPSAILDTASYIYEFFKHPWTLETAIAICQRRSGNLIYIENEAEMNQTRDWIRFDVTDKLPYSRAGYYWTGGKSVDSNPLTSNYQWFWHGVSVSNTYQNFCPNHTADILQDYWDKNPTKRTLTVILDFRRGHVMEPTMGCWRLSFPMVELNELRDEHKDLAGNPFICKKVK